MSLILVVICLVISVTGESQKSKPVITWKLSTNPVRFGGSLILNCTTSYQEKCSGEIHRIWTIGNDDDLISNNGVLGKKYANSPKYSEQTSDSCRHSSLIVTDVNEKDFSIPYTCSFGYPGKNNTSIWVSKTDLLLLIDNEYEYYPTQNMLESWEIRKGGRSKLSAHIKKIYPVPSCVIYIQGQHQPDLNITTNKNGLFFSVDMYTDYLLGDYLPTDDWCIHCTFNDMDFSIMNNGVKSLECGVANEDPLVLMQVVFGLLYAIFPLIDFLDDLCFQFLKYDNPLAKTVMRIIKEFSIFSFGISMCVIPLYLTYSSQSSEGLQAIARSEQTTKIDYNILHIIHLVYFGYKLVYILLLPSSEKEKRKTLFYRVVLNLRMVFTVEFIIIINEYKPNTTLHHVILWSWMLLSLGSYHEANRFKEYITEENSKKGTNEAELSTAISKGINEKLQLQAGATDNGDTIIRNNSDICSQEDDYNRGIYKKSEDSASVNSDSAEGLYNAQRKKEQ